MSVKKRLLICFHIFEYIFIVLREKETYFFPQKTIIIVVIFIKGTTKIQKAQQKMSRDQL